MLDSNQPAPEFSAPDQHGKTISLTEYAGKNVVLYFYPKDDTPGCTIEANDFTKLSDQFSELDTVIIGVSKDSSESHARFIDKYNLQLVLLADTDGAICERYGVWQEKQKDGVTAMGMVRSTFIIDKQGQLVDVNYAVSPQGHAQEILEKVRNL
ncbi:MAG TPA: peroxiredoxin [Crenotrichaceae bacterium]|nr:peroxiredoxin [Crenotrichaceae bacterium]